MSDKRETDALKPTVTNYPGSRLQVWRQRLVTVVFLMLSIAVFLFATYIKNPFSHQKYYGWEVQRKAPSFTLTSTKNQPVDIADFKGNFVYLMFGYLNCDEVCHTQALTFHGLNQQIQSDQVQFVYLGMDPELDTPEKITAYFDSRGNNFTGLVADDVKQAQRIASDFHAYFSIEPDQGSGVRRINHPGYIYLIDPQGNIRLVYSGSNLSLEKMITDLNKIASEFT